MDPLSVWQDRYDIRLYEADAAGRANITALANYVQNSAANHYNTLDRRQGPFLAETDVWMMTRMELRVEAVPKWQDEIVVETWSRSIDRVSATREFLIRDRNGKTAALGTTLWVVMDTQSRRLQRLNALASRWPSLPERTFINKLPDKVPELKNGSRGPAFRAQYSDIDVNRHVNNVKYIEWMIDSYPHELLESSCIGKVEINFLDSALAGDEVTVGTEKISEDAFLNNVIRMRDGREICRARIEFNLKQ